MHDGVSLEALAIPTAVVVTTEFEHEAEVQRIALGMAGLKPVVIQHPLSTLSDAEIEARAADAVRQAIAIWLAPEG
jgi:CO/xanthine dehydrogenase FAD-binding subunit